MHRSRFRHDVYMQWMRPSLRFSHFHQYLLQGIVRDSAITERAIEFKLQKYFSLHLMARKWTFLNTNIGILLFNPWSIACGRTLTACMYAHNQAIVFHRLLPGHRHFHVFSGYNNIWRNQNAILSFQIKHELSFGTTPIYACFYTGLIS